MVDWLFSFANTEAKLPRFAHEFNLPRTEALLALLGDPQRRFPSVVIAGTKGKGSTAAMTEAILRAAGLRVGLYTSPHLHTLRERVQVDRELIGAEELAALVAEMRPLVAPMDPSLGPLSTYEVTTGLALRHFAARRVDVAVLEIGLGGRYDAVNAVTPVVSAISAISYDHVESLGGTLEAIAHQKAGIVKPGVPVVTVPQDPAAAAVVARVAGEQGAPLFVAEPEGLRDAASGLLRPHLAPVRAETVGLRGEFQLENARLACGVARLLLERGMPVTPEAARAGLAGVGWPGRLETLRERPLVVADGAHNGASAQRLAAALRQLFPRRRLHLVLAASADKDFAAIAEALAPAADTIYLTRTAHPRAAAVEQLRAAVAPLARGAVHSAADVAEALTRATAAAQPDDIICVTGSLFAAAAAREACGVAAPEPW
jgi:dihydrofolate synthase/folylpolyglutamate synthase